MFFIGAVNYLNIIFDYFVVEDENQVATCQTCLKQLKFVRGSTRKNDLAKHLRRHPEVYDHFSQRKMAYIVDVSAMYSFFNKNHKA